MRKAEYKPFYELLFIDVECPYCNYENNLEADEDNVSKIPFEWCGNDDENILCRIDELDDVHVTKIFKCAQCGKDIEVHGCANI